MLKQPLSKSSVVKGVNIKDILEGTFEEEDSSNFNVSLNFLRAAQVGVLNLWDLPLILTVVWPERRKTRLKVCTPILKLAMVKRL